MKTVYFKEKFSGFKQDMFFVYAKPRSFDKNTDYLSYLDGLDSTLSIIISTDGLTDQEIDDLKTWVLGAGWNVG